MCSDAVQSFSPLAARFSRYQEWRMPSKGRPFEVLRLPATRWWPATLAVAVFLISLVCALRAGLRSTEGRLVYALDDAYIHMAVAKNLAEAGVWGCTPFHFSSSSSSPLW